MQGVHERMGQRNSLPQYMRQLAQGHTVAGEGAAPVSSGGEKRLLGDERGRRAAVDADAQRLGDDVRGGHGCDLSPAGLNRARTIAEGLVAALAASFTVFLVVFVLFHSVVRWVLDVRFLYSDLVLAFVLFLLARPLPWPCTSHRSRPQTNSGMLGSSMYMRCRPCHVSFL